jgi:hypothetical protein
MRLDCWIWNEDGKCITRVNGIRLGLYDTQRSEEGDS